MRPSLVFSSFLLFSWPIELTVAGVCGLKFSVTLLCTQDKTILFVSYLPQLIE